MGFNLNKARAAKEEILKSFTPLDLNEANVEAVYNRCLATEEEKKDIDRCKLATIFYKTNTGIDSDTILFSRAHIEKNSKVIDYLFGQLKNVHKPRENRILTLQDVSVKYNGTLWTEDMEYMFKLLNLAYTTGQFPTFTRQANTIYTARAKNTIPTLSPKAPAFPAWWEAHKAEWEDKT